MQRRQGVDLQGAAVAVEKPIRGLRKGSLSILLNANLKRGKIKRFRERANTPDLFKRGNRTGVNEGRNLGKEVSYENGRKDIYSLSGKGCFDATCGKRIRQGERLRKTEAIYNKAMNSKGFRY